MKSMKQSLDTMNLGAFSVSLAVKDIEASRRFYEKLGFKIFAGDASQNWLILKNGDHAPRPVSRDVQKEHPHL
jgi:catechol 2,3-dioxygenase-like lactoylglutathione lyase family enzyme